MVPDGATRPYRGHVCSGTCRKRTGHATRACLPLDSGRRLCWCCRGQVLGASRVSMVQRVAPLRSILVSPVISGTPRLSVRAT
jgi:hypothetical protein